jgi:phage terminase large subunit GpA-like protein
VNVADGYAAIMDAVARAMAPDPELHLDTWAEDNVIVTPPASVPGPYRLEHTPYARRVLQALSPRDPAKRVVVRAASQMLKTQVFICAALGWISQGNANILALEPTDKLAKRLSKRIGTAIEACDAVAEKVAKPRSRDSRNTVDCKDFEGGSIYITTAGSSSNLAEIPARYVFLDEVDRMPRNVDGEGNAPDLAEARTTSHEGEQKVYIVSTPTIEDHSEIDDQFERGTQEAYHVPCPHCDELHELVLDNFRHHQDEISGIVDRAWFVCPHCGCEIEESHKGSMLRDEPMGGKAKWVPTSLGDGETVSLDINAFYAPPGSVNWLGLARQKVRAEEAEKLGNAEPKRVFMNTRVARSYAYASDLPAASDLKDRALDYPEQTIPAGGLLLTAGVDVQHDRLAVVIRAWGRGEESWLVYWGEIYGSTLNPDAGAWTDLDSLLGKRFAHAWGGNLGISAASIDGSDGNRTEIVNAYVRKRRHRNFMSVKGASEQTGDRREIFAPPRVVDPGKQNKKPAKFGLQQHIVGTGRAKDLILETRARLVGEGSGRMHAYTSVRADYWDQLTSEVKIPTGPKRRLAWTKKSGVRNEALDCEVYALHAARSQKTNLLRDGHWDALESRFRQRSLIDTSEPQDDNELEAPQSVAVPEQSGSGAEKPPAVAEGATPHPEPQQPRTPTPPAEASPPAVSKKARPGRTAKRRGGFVNGY